VIPAPADVAAPSADATVTASGLASRVLEPGTGTKHPTARSRVLVHYSGWTTDGKMFDSSMVEGEKRRFWIPEALAYRGQPGAPAGMLVFDVELIRIES
jgi:FKBP-type peptidyl-prolyl cis-trans isomerase